MSKIDELMRIFDNEAKLPIIRKADFAGIRAVVRALRDEFADIMHPGDDWNRQGILEQFDQILGAAGNEKVAGGPTREDGRSSEAGGFLAAESAASTPATDPAPAVCEWREISVLDGIDHYSTAHGVKNRLHLYRKEEVCPFCLAPIKFTEAK